MHRPHLYDISSILQNVGKWQQARKLDLIKLSRKKFQSFRFPKVKKDSTLECDAAGL
jgi:hypothetical protein